MVKHTIPGVLIAIAVLLTGVLGSMQNVEAATNRTVAVAAGAAKLTKVSSVASKNSVKKVASEPTDKIFIEVVADKDASSDNAPVADVSEIGGIPTDKLVMANVDVAVNIREDGDEESSIVGKLYTECAGKKLDEKDNWTKIVTGNVTGWVRNDYLLFGNDAINLAKKVVTKTATSTTGCLRVRSEADTEASCLGLLAEGDEIDVVKEEGDWVKVEYSDGDIGYVSAEYVIVDDELQKGESIEVINAREEALKREREEAKKAKSSKNSSSKSSNKGAQLTQSVAVSGDVSDVQLLAALIQAEAGNQPYEGQVAIGDVVVNRLRSGKYGSSIYSVIYAKGQFGPAGRGQVAAICAQGAKATCVKAAQDALNGSNYVGGATHFRNVSSGYQGVVIGSHVFW